MKKETLLKAIYVTAVVLLSLALVYLALKETVPDLIPLIRNGSADEIQEYLAESSTGRGILCVILLQMVQVWSLFIPGMPIQVAAGCVYGFFTAFAVCHLSSTAAQAVAITVWRRTGRSLEKWLPVDLNQTGRLDEFLGTKAPPAYIVLLACMIPVMPNGLIAIYAAKTGLSVKKYTLCIWSGSLINVLLCCAVGSRIIQGDWGIACLFAAILVTLFVLMWVLRDRILSLYYRTRYRRSALTPDTESV